MRGEARVFTQADTIVGLLTLGTTPRVRKILFQAVGSGIEMHHRVFREQVTVGVEFKIIAGFVRLSNLFLNF